MYGDSAFICTRRGALTVATWVAFRNPFHGKSRALTRLSNTLSSRTLKKISSIGESTASLERLFQWLIVLTVKTFPLECNQSITGAACTHCPSFLPCDPDSRDFAGSKEFAFLNWDDFYTENLSSLFFLLEEEIKESLFPALVEDCLLGLTLFWFLLRCLEGRLGLALISKLKHRNELHRGGAAVNQSIYYYFFIYFSFSATQGYAIRSDVCAVLWSYTFSPPFPFSCQDNLPVVSSLIYSSIFKAVFSSSFSSRRNP